jgi:hypothetical protein
LRRLEAAYLGLLRVVVLIAATLALLAAGVRLLSAVPPLLRWLGITEAKKPSGGTLQEFIDEQRITGASGNAPSTSSPEPFVLDDIKTAAKTIHDYLGKRATSPESAWRQSLQSAADTLPGHQVEYAASAKEMADQLASGTGKPLSETRVAQLFDWQKNRFEADLQARAARQAEGNVRFWVTVAGSGAAFLAFVLIVFVFLFVKIERSLRVVHTVRLPQEEEAAHVMEAA